MIKRKCSLILSVIAAVGILGGCQIDVNQLVSSSRNEAQNSSAVESESTASEENTASEAFYGPDSDTETETDLEIVSQALFDTSAYKTMYVTGAGQIDVIEDAKEGSKVVGSLPCGDGVSFINSVVTSRNTDETEFTFVYSETLGNFGYLKNINLVEDYTEVAYGEIYYVKSDSSPFYADNTGSAIIRYLSKNDMVTILAKFADGMWRVSDKSGKVGYMSVSLLSEEKIVAKAASSKSESKSNSKTESKTSSKSESKLESQAESRVESQIESKVESKQEPSLYVGAGEAPTSGYTVYTVDVDLGYLALRGEPSADTDSILGELYYEEQVYVIDTSGEFWYIYALSLGMYGYVKGNYDYLYVSY